MKKIAIISFACTAALLTLASCDQSLLDIPQKGVVAYESFYKTDEDAESALVSAYANVVKMYGKLTSNTPSYNIFYNAAGDELYWGGSKKEDHIAALEINEFRSTFESTNGHLAAMYSPKTAPKELTTAQKRLDRMVDALYGLTEPSSLDRIRALFQAYEKAAQGRQFSIDSF